MADAAKQSALAAAVEAVRYDMDIARLNVGARPFHWNEETLYAAEGACRLDLPMVDGRCQCATMLFSDIERTRWVKTTHWPAVEGELVLSWDTRPHSRVTWAQPASAAGKKAA